MRRPEGSLFNSYNTKAQRRALLLSLDWSTLPLIRTLYCRVLSKEVSSTIFKVFGMTWPRIEPWCPGPLANTLPTIGLMSRVFTNGLGDRDSIPGRVIPKTQKMLLDATLLRTQHYKVRIKGKVDQLWEWSTPYPTPQCSSYWKGSIRVDLD